MEEDGWSGQGDMTAEWSGKISKRQTSFSSTSRLMSRGLEGREGAKECEGEDEKGEAAKISFSNCWIGAKAVRDEKKTKGKARTLIVSLTVGVVSLGLAFF